MQNKILHLCSETQWSKNFKMERDTVLLRRFNVALCYKECLDIEVCRPHKEGSELEDGKIKCVISHGSQTLCIFD